MRLKFVHFFRNFNPLDRNVQANSTTLRPATAPFSAPLYTSGEIAAILSDHAFDWLDAPVKRLAAENVPIPMSRTLEPLVRPSEAAIADAVRALVGQR